MPWLHGQRCLWAFFSPGGMMDEWVSVRTVVCMGGTLVAVFSMSTWGICFFSFASFGFGFGVSFRVFGARAVSHVGG
ncbi:hypothetical protein B0T22DRAFT_468657 [Podospora appendiculata]|uniref:Transmembrane protein n=1 Tax=Podospora appendiculata TaxID=314037 RepID=A0AAE0X2Q3_9PEZI|nr:hypothetical protein B0T22DRAFT_468657 [Podospora appendiculata]